MSPPLLLPFLLLLPCSGASPLMCRLARTPGIATVSTVRDFTVIFDAYSQYEESMLAAQMETMESMPEVRTALVL